MLLLHNVNIQVPKKWLHCHSLRWIIRPRRIALILEITILRLVDREPVLHMTIIPLNDESCVIEVVVNNLSVSPATVLVEQRQGSVPMKQSDNRLNTVLHQFGNNIVVVCDACFIDRASSKGEDTGPADARTERFYSEGLDASEVLLIEVVVACCYVCCGIVGNVVYYPVAEEIPY